MRNTARTGHKSFRIIECQVLQSRVQCVTKKKERKKSSSYQLKRCKNTDSCSILLNRGRDEKGLNTHLVWHRALWILHIFCFCLVFFHDKKREKKDYLRNSLEEYSRIVTGNIFWKISYSRNWKSNITLRPSYLPISAKLFQSENIFLESEHRGFEYKIVWFFRGGGFSNSCFRFDSTSSRLSTFTICAWNNVSVYDVDKLIMLRYKRRKRECERNLQNLHDRIWYMNKWVRRLYNKYECFIQFSNTRWSPARNIVHIL